MAEREIRAIIQKARQRWTLRHVAVAHRIGFLRSEVVAREL